MKNNYILPLAFVGLFFFAIGFSLGINGVLTPVLKESLQISSFESNLVIAATFLPFVLFSYPASLCIRGVGYKNTMVLAFVLFAIAMALFIPAVKYESFPIFLLASFVCGSGNATLQTAVNPYITILGPLESAAQRISIMGICNKLATPTTFVFMAVVVGKSGSELTIADLTTPFIILIACFLLLALTAFLSPLPEVKAEGEEAPQSPEGGEKDGMESSPIRGQRGLFAFPHLIYGAITLFLYVGVETIAILTLGDYARSLGMDNVEALSYVPIIGMVIGYIIGATCIPKILSQVLAMRLCAITAIIGSILVCIMPPSISVWCLFLLGLGCSLMWPALWPMAIADLGNFTKQGSAL
ncbi:MAG: MFS transporter, partial [Bacteroidaceae bacterium]|nr:MFS transporter [Bacteroidaceae bacterium]